MYRKKKIQGTRIFKVIGYSKRQCINQKILKKVKNEIRKAGLTLRHSQGKLKNFDLYQSPLRCEI